MSSLCPPNHWKQWLVRRPFWIEFQTDWMNGPNRSVIAKGAIRREPCAGNAGALTSAVIVVYEPDALT